MDFATQMEAAKNGVLTEAMKQVAKEEAMDERILMSQVAKGTIIIPKNKRHKALHPKGIGNGLATKINVNLGVSKDCQNYEMEMAKVQEAVRLGADAIMDLSSSGDTQKFRQKLVDSCPSMIGTVPVYDAVLQKGKDLKELTARDFLDIVRLHAESGVDFMTIHCGVTRATMAKLKANGRLTNIVSRGGALVYSWMSMTGNENPFYEYYDEILDICREYDVTMSLGDACRPGCIADSTDVCQIDELVTLGELTRRAWEKDVQVMVEGPGHMTLDEVSANMQVQQKICKGAPFYVLGPLVTDVAPGYDHITSAIGGAIAAFAGASFLCYVTPAEHLCLPDLDDMKEGIIASKIAAHAADLAKGIPGAREWDNQMSAARQKLDWDEMFRLAIDGGEKGKRYREKSSPENPETCTMCGKFCSIRNMNKALQGQTVDLL